MGNGADHLPLHRQQALQVLGHAIEGRRQPPYRVGADIRHAGFQIARGDARGRAFQHAQALLQLAHQQVDRQADQRQPEHADQHQQLRRIGVHLMQRAELHDPACTGNGGEHAHRITAAGERHHRIALVQSPTLVVIEVGAVAGQQLQIEAEAARPLQLGKALWLFGFGITNQLVDQQIDGGARQLLAELLHLAGEHQPILRADQAEHRGALRADLLDQHLPAQQARLEAAFQADIIQRPHPQRDTQQPPPQVRRLTPLDGRHAAHVVRHQTEGAAGQALAVIVRAVLVEQMQPAGAEQRHQHQHAEHAAVDAQKDRIHGERRYTIATAASDTNR